MHKFINRHPFLSFLFGTIGLTLIASFFAGCGGDPACQNGGCGPDPTTDGGTTDTGTGTQDVGVEDAGTADSGDKPDAGADPCADYAWFAGDYKCQGTTPFETTCEIWAEANVCYSKCTEMTNKVPVNDPEFTLAPPNGFTFNGKYFTATCTKK